MKKILWLSRHAPSQKHIESLRSFFQEEVHVDHQRRSVDNPRQIVQWLRRGGYHELVLNAPLSVFEQLCRQGTKPLYIENVPEDNPAQVDFYHTNRKLGFRFQRFRRVTGVHKQFIEVEPLARDGGIILWVSQHPPSDSQVMELQKVFGTVGVEHDPQLTFKGAEAVAEHFDQGAYADLVAVCPLAMLDHLCRQGLAPLWAESVQENDPPRIEFRGARGQGFRFLKFMRLRKVHLVFED
jgi:hypothetical protein